ncbi:hypothetical protein PHBOTO_002186 [Pseudozyma hubeiensis]|nr:hypothetical protein PHBOTO_002186 [Pseudozyma hubeiensis]
MAAATMSSAAFDPADSVAMSSQSSVSVSFWDNLSRHWTEADSNKQTLMAILLILQLVALFCFIKRSLDKMFGRRAEYRNQRTKHFARRAAVAAAGGSSKTGIPLSHQRPLYRSDIKPQLPPRPSQNHPLRSSGPSTSQPSFETTSTGDIVLPSWTDAGPTPLRVIIEEPEESLSRSNSPLPSRPHSPAMYRDAQRSPVSAVYQDVAPHHWAHTSNSQRDSTSLRLRERNDYSMLPFNIDRSSTPDTRLEEVRRPFSRPSPAGSHFYTASQPAFADPLSAQSFSPA